jgi:hypothetical protein
MNIPQPQQCWQDKCAKVPVVPNIRLPSLMIIDPVHGGPDLDPAPEKGWKQIQPECKSN